MMEDEKTYTVKFEGCTIEVYGVCAKTPEEADKIASDDLDLIQNQNPNLAIWTETYAAEED